MFCAQCGREAEYSARFCSACGASLTRNAPPRQARIVRPRSPRLIAGVCLGIALHFGWNVALVRIVTLVFMLSYGVGLLAYIVAWIAMPESPYALAAESHKGTAV